jgi:opacity protein-like surface antigen
VTLGLVSASSTAWTAEPTGWTFEFTAGAGIPTGDLSSRLTTGWDVDVGAGYQFNSVLGLLGELGFGRLGIPSDLLQQLQAPDGRGKVWSLTLDPVIRFALTRRFDGYVTGGAGWYRRTVELTAPTTQVIDVVDPLYGDLGPVYIPTDQVLSSTTRTSFGGNVGGGLSLPLGDTGASAFIDVRYHRAPTISRTTSIVPVTFGIRWTGRSRP